MRFYRIASLDGGGGGWNMEGEYKVEKKIILKKKKKLIKGWIIMLPSLRRKIILYDLLSHI